MIQRIGCDHPTTSGGSFNLLYGIQRGEVRPEGRYRRCDPAAGQMLFSQEVWRPAAQHWHIDEEEL